MGKDMELINIYLKIHHKRTLTMDDLRYLAEYDPECFEKTCRNVIYNMPDAKPILQLPAVLPALPAPTQPDSDMQGIDIILDNLNNMEQDPSLYAAMDSQKVKDLLGNLYMELLFPHNDKEELFSAAYEPATTRFDRKA